MLHFINFYYMVISPNFLCILSVKAWALLISFWILCSMFLLFCLTWQGVVAGLLVQNALKYLLKFGQVTPYLVQFKSSSSSLRHILGIMHQMSLILVFDIRVTMPSKIISQQWKWSQTINVQIQHVWNAR